MGRLLLLEDDPDIADSLEMILALDGHTIRHTANGKEALLLAAREAWDLVILDIDVDELSGLAVARALADFSDLPTLVLSASASPWQQEAFAAGAVACLRKPFDMEALRALVRTLIAEPPLHHEPHVARLSDADLERVRSLTPEALDELPFGVIRVDRAGTIVGFNEYESAASRLPRAAVLGRPFAEVAPCTQVQEFASAIAEGIRAGKLDRVLRFVFPTHGALSLVSVRLHFDSERSSIWIFVSRRAPGVAEREVSRSQPTVAPA
ncbi:MAG: response regulator [Polyangia bacterium]